MPKSSHDPCATKSPKAWPQTRRDKVSIPSSVYLRRIRSFFSAASVESNGGCWLDLPPVTGRFLCDLSDQSHEKYDFTTKPWDFLMINGLLSGKAYTNHRFYYQQCDFSCNFKLGPFPGNTLKQS